VSQSYPSPSRRSRRRAGRVGPPGGRQPGQRPSTQPIKGSRPGRRPPPAPTRNTSPFSDPRIAAGVVIAGLVIVAAVVLLLGGGGAAVSPSASTGSSAAAHGTNCPTSQPPRLPAGETRTVKISTAKGDIVIQVKADLSPIATGNFVALAQCGFYNNLVFHRTATMQDGTPFVIQGGDPNGNGGGGPGYSIQDEPVTATYHRGTVAMARSDAPNSQGSQFFIVLDDAAAGPLASANTYAILGEVTSGMEVADAIYQASNGAETPSNPIAMTSVTVTNP
jgi:peptidyl-prolyl cis-trans isomerase B (cyclophilin B)